MSIALTTLVLSSSLAFAQDEDWRIEKDERGQYICSSDQFEYGYARKAIGETRIQLSRYGSEDDICFLIPKELISTTSTESKIMIEVGYKAEERSGYYRDGYYVPIPKTTPRTHLSSWSVDVYTQNGSVSLKSSSWEIREETKDWERRLGKDKENEAEVVEIPPHLEYQLCIARAVERAEVTYQRPDKQVDYITLKKIESDKLNPETCFVIDKLLVGMDGIFTVRGHYAPRNEFAEPESIVPFPVFTKNGFVALKPISEDVKNEPNHYYSKTPPANECIRRSDDHATVHFEDRDAKHMQAYATRKGEETRLELIGNASPQDASFYVPGYIARGYGFIVYAQDAEGNRSREFALTKDTVTRKMIPTCE